jgi:uncharacterized cysteine cluster protein YcgN (CxxCxxCC family)
MDAEKTNESEATILCKSCGLCCSGHLFAWVKLRTPELEPVQALGLNVLRTPQHRGFNQPCPLWNGQCTIYDSPYTPRACKTYQCKLLKKVLDETVTLPEAVNTVQRAKQMIRDVEVWLPASPTCNFRDRLVAYMELPNANPEIKQKVVGLLIFYKDHFGVNDLADLLEDP